MTAGVAIILNKALIAPTSVKTTILKKGRAMTTCIMNIYAPNERGEHPTFWAQIDLERHWKCLPKPDFVLGDFNVTEDGINRSPPQDNERIVTDTLRETRLDWNIQDQWRHNNLSGRAFTHKHIRNGKFEYAQLDRIYTGRELANNLFRWKVRPSAVPTDHWLVSVKYAPKDAPLIGGGRWTWPLAALNDEPLIEKIIRKGIQMQKEVEEILENPTERQTKSPQQIWRDFKTEIKRTTKKEH